MDYRIVVWEEILWEIWTKAQSLGLSVAEDAISRRDGVWGRGPVGFAPNLLKGGGDIV